jgi:hypothetical protein
MKQHTSRLYVMSLALASGVSFDNAYGIDDLHVKATADLPQSSGRAGHCGE